MQRQSRGRIRNDSGSHDGGKPIGSQATQHARYRRILAQLCGGHDLATLLRESYTHARSKLLGRWLDSSVPMDVLSSLGLN